LFFRQDLVQTDFQLFEKHFKVGTKSIRKGDVESAIQEFRYARDFYRGVFLNSIFIFRNRKLEESIFEKA
ncbi:bacterial transcriptional activator domain protein, partial [Leptospira interrogans serovar Bataviae str. HAI135]